MLETRQFILFDTEGREQFVRTQADRTLHREPVPAVVLAEGTGAEGHESATSTRHVDNCLVLQHVLI